MRLQAIVRGRLVRKQADVTLRCMQALVRAQARARAQSAPTTDCPVTLRNQSGTVKQTEVNIPNYIIYASVSIGRKSFQLLFDIYIFTCRVDGAIVMEQQKK